MYTTKIDRDAIYNALVVQLAGDIWRQTLIEAEVLGVLPTVDDMEAEFKNRSDWLVDQILQMTGLAPVQVNLVRVNAVADDILAQVKVIMTSE